MKHFSKFSLSDKIGPFTAFCQPLLPHVRPPLLRSPATALQKKTFNMAEWISARHTAVIFVKKKKYTFYFPHQIEEMDENGIAVCNIHVEHGKGTKVKKMSCKMMDREEALLRMKDRNVNYFRPLVGF